MKFLIDENLPPRLAQWLIDHSHDIITQDSDFENPVAPLRVVRIALGNAPTARLLAWFEQQFPTLTARLQTAERFIELK
jgi:predicted nuclease of predicted toxin-antitoxin system